MAWIEASVVAQRAAFVAAVMSGETPMNWLCADYGISRKTGYKWLERYAAEGARGLLDRSRAPKRHGRATSAEIAEAIVEMKRARPYWGPRKLLARLAHIYPDTAWPFAFDRERALEAARADDAATAPAACVRDAWKAGHAGAA